jgi:transketolase
LDEKFKAFGWHVIKIDGHSFAQIDKAVNEAKSIKEQPIIIIAKTIKGKGISFMEDQVGWHGTAPSKEQAEQALAELGEVE